MSEKNTTLLKEEKDDDSMTGTPFGEEVHTTKLFDGAITLDEPVKETMV